MKKRLKWYFTVLLKRLGLRVSCGHHLNFELACFPSKFEICVDSIQNLKVKLEQDVQKTNFKCFYQNKNTKKLDFEQNKTIFEQLN